MKKVIGDISLKLIFTILKNCMNLIIIYHFYQKKRKLKNLKSLQLIYMIQLNIYAQKKFKIDINYGLVLKDVHRATKFNQNVWLKQYIDMNIDLRSEAKNDFGKDIFLLVTTERKRNYFISIPNFHATKFF